MKLFTLVWHLCTPAGMSRTPQRLSQCSLAIFIICLLSVFLMENRCNVMYVWRLQMVVRKVRYKKRKTLSTNTHPCLEKVTPLMAILGIYVRFLERKIKLKPSPSKAGTWPSQRLRRQIATVVNRSDDGRQKMQQQQSSSSIKASSKGELGVGKRKTW